MRGSEGWEASEDIQSIRVNERGAQKDEKVLCKSEYDYPSTVVITVMWITPAIFIRKTLL